jgi:integrator complex subunit 6
MLLISSVDLGNGMSLAIGSTLKDEETTSRSFRNPFDITRSGLLGQLARMRTNFLHSTPTTPNLIEEGEREVPYTWFIE